MLQSHTCVCTFFIISDITNYTMDAFKGKYERTSADKYEEMLKELDVNFLLRKAATVSTPGVFPCLAKYGSAAVQTGLLLQFVISRRRGASGPSRPPPPSRPWSLSSR